MATEAEKLYEEAARCKPADAMQKLDAEHAREQWLVAQRKTAHRTPWAKEDVRELKAHSKARTPLPEIAKKMKRTERALLRKGEFSASAWDIAAESPLLQERRGPMR